MSRQSSFRMSALTLILSVACSCAYGVERGRQPGGRQSPGGSWSERSHQAGSTHHQHQYPQSAQRPTEAAGRNARNRQSHQNVSGADATALKKRNNATTPEHKDAAAGAAAANRRQPQRSTADDAAAGAAISNRRSPQDSGAEGAAAGAAVANRRQPQYSGVDGAAAGAAVANRNQPDLSGAQGAAVGAAAANRNSPAFSGAAGAVAGSAAVRNSFNNYNLYGADWKAANPGVWATGSWAAGNAWTPTNWAAVSNYVGATSEPTWYDYGVNVTNQDGTVTMNGQAVGSAEDYGQQASDLAQSGGAANASPDDEWMPLGVFAMVRNEQQHPQLIFQLAINKNGVIAGNFTDEITEHTRPISGAADPKTQRAAWTVGDNKNVIVEAGLSNLAEGEAPALIHKNGKTDHWLLVRLQQPPDQNNDGASAAAPPASQ